MTNCIALYRPRIDVCGFVTLLTAIDSVARRALRLSSSEPHDSWRIPGNFRNRSRGLQVRPSVDNRSKSTKMGAPADAGEVTREQTSSCQEEDAKVCDTENIPLIRRQVEYYFSDSNLPRDRFLLAKMDENEGSWVSIGTILTFNKMKTLKASTEQVLVALSSSELIEIDKEKERIRRRTPLPDPQEQVGRSLYAKGWIATDPEPSVESIEELFAPYGKVILVRIRKWHDENHALHFKGSVFVEFENAESMERAAADKHVIQVNDRESGEKVDKELIVHEMEAYLELKKAESRERSRMYKQRKAALKAALQETSGSSKQKGRALVEASEFEKGLILRVDKIPDNSSREDLKESLELFGDIAWVDFERGQSSGFVRFSSATSAAAASTAVTEAKVHINGKAFTGTVLHGDSEQSYWTKVWELQDKVRKSKKRSYGSSRGGNSSHKRQRTGSRNRGRG